MRIRYKNKKVRGKRPRRQPGTHHHPSRGVWFPGLLRDRLHTQQQVPHERRPPICRRQTRSDARAPASCLARPRPKASQALASILSSASLHFSEAAQQSPEWMVCSAFHQRPSDVTAEATAHTRGCAVPSNVPANLQGQLLTHSEAEYF